MDKKKYYKFYHRAIEKMMEVAGYNMSFDEVKEVSKSDSSWYLRYEWTQLQENEYKKWLVDEIRRTFKMNKYTSEVEASYLLLNWGLKTKAELKCSQCGDSAVRMTSPDLDIAGIPLCAKETCYYELVAELTNTQ